MNEIKKIESSKAPKAIGPYSQAVEYNGLIFVSGQIPIDPETGKLVPEGIKEQTHQCIKNISAILKSGSTSLENVLKIEIFVANILDFDIINAIYVEYFNGNIKPARSVVEVSAIPKGALVEMACVAVCGMC